MMVGMKSANPWSERLDRPNPRAQSKVLGFLKARQKISFLAASIKTFVPIFSRRMRRSATILSSGVRNLAVPGAFEIAKKARRPDPWVMMTSS